MRVVRSLLIVFTVAFCSIAHAAGTDQWFSLKQEGFTLEYQTSEADIAARALPSIVERFKSIRLDKFREELNIVKTRKKEILIFIASELGMKKPGTQMSSVYDKFSILFPVLVNSLNKARDFRLWDRAKLKSFLAAGGKIPGFSYIKDTDDIFFNINVTDPNVPPFTGPLPLVLDRAKGDLSEQVSAQLGTYESAVRNIPGAGVIFHEVAEFGMTADIGMISPFRRWLCEGAANDIAARTLRKFVGEKSAREYEGSFNTEADKSTPGEIDLVAWRAIEWDKITPPWASYDLTQTYYNHATKAFFDHVSGTSPENVPALFSIISARKEKTDADIYHALRLVTGKDMRKILEKQYPPSKNPFRGFAVKLLEVRPMAKKADGSWELLSTADAMPLKQDGSRGFRMIMTYATLGRPAEMKVEFIGNGMKDHDFFMQTLNKNQDTIAVDMVFRKSDLKPGPAELAVYINGSVLQKISFMLKAE